MTQCKNNQDGFGAIEIFVVSLVVVVLGLTSFVLFKHSHKTSTKTALTPTSQTPVQPTTTSTVQAEHPAPQYLDIKEWGLRLPLSDSIKDAYYLANPNAKGFDGITEQAYIGLKSLDDSGCAVTSVNGGNSNGQVSAVALIFRAKPSDRDPGTNKTYSEVTPIGATIDGYFYGYGDYANRSSSSCKAPQTTVQAIDSAFADALKEATVAQ